MSQDLKMLLAMIRQPPRFHKIKHYRTQRKHIKVSLKSTRFWIMIRKKRDVTTIYVVRHGESQSNVYARENPDKPASQFGTLGSSLTKKGREQASYIAKRLQNVHIDAIFSSDLARAKETAEIIASRRKVKIITNKA